MTGERKTCQPTTAAATTTRHRPGESSDPNFDQQYKPQGSLFVELYNPWSDLEPVPGELSKTSKQDRRRSDQDNAGRRRHGLSRLAIGDCHSNAMQ